MSNKIYLLLIIISIFTKGFSQNFSIQKIQSTKKDQLEISFKNETKAFQFVKINNQNYIDFSKNFKITTLSKGKPCLPTFGESIVIPNKGISSLTYTYDSIITLENILIAPSKGNIKRNVNPEEIEYSFDEVYLKNEFYPSQIATLNEPFILRTIRGQVLSLVPYQYNPVSKTLKIYSNLSIRIDFDENQVGINELNTTEINFSDAKSFKDIFINPISVSKYSQIEESGDYLVISPENYHDSIKSLLQWKFEKGFKTHLRFTSETGETTQEIKTYIENFYIQNPQLKYILLIGDHEQIPAYSYGTSIDGETLYSDSYYGQIVGSDYYPEAFVGRLSGSSTQVSTMVKRILEYEKNPLPGDWMTKAIGLASSQGAGFGDDNQADWQHMREIHDQLKTFGYTEVYEFYDGTRSLGDADGNPTSSMILNEVSSGIGLFNYTGHGDINTCISGNFSSSNINAGTNNGKYPFVISVACNNGTFPGTTCISEAWLRATENNSPAGAIAACGSSILMAWAPPMQTQDEMTNIITESVPTNIKTSLGGLFYNAQLSMMENYPIEGVEVMQTWILFGDPSVEFRNKITQNLSVIYDSCILELNTQDITFTANENNVLISLTQNETSLGQGILSNGSLNLSLTNIDLSVPIKVVCTKPNFKAQIGNIFYGETCNVTPIIGELKIYPNPASKSFTLDLGQKQTNLVYEIYDVTGKLVKNYSKLNFDSDKEEVNIELLANGMYSIVIRNWQNTEVIKFIVQQ